jgi:hypothetical protein
VGQTSLRRPLSPRTSTLRSFRGHFSLRRFDRAERQQGAILLRRKTGDDARGERREDERAGQRRLDQLKVTKADIAVAGDDDMIVQGQPERRRDIVDFPRLRRCRRLMGSYAATGSPTAREPLDRIGELHRVDEAVTVLARIADHPARRSRNWRRMREAHACPPHRR